MSKVRIIGGQWRGRWIRFTEAEGLRPTGDRMRETLFNWLQAHIRDARCLDLFAGTGALGIEAVSRGAAVAVLVECNPAVCRQLQSQIEALASGQSDVAERLPVHASSAAAYLQAQAAQPQGTGDHAVPGNKDCFDIIFIDPPFSLDVQTDILVTLRQSGLLAPHAMVYVEAPADGLVEARLPDGYEVYRTLSYGNVNCLLLQTVPLAQV